MRILILGSAGSMGERYVAILKSLGHQPIGFDMPQILDPLPEVDRVIIASNTSSHIECISRVISLGCPILVEKPMVTKFETSILLDSRFTELRQVNNWEHLPNIVPDGKNEIHYDYFRAGKSNDRWDLMQPRWLARNGLLHICLSSPVFNVSINGHSLTQRDFDESYVRMIKYWLIDSPIGGSTFKVAKEMIEWISP